MRFQLLSVALTFVQIGTLNGTLGQAGDLTFLFTRSFCLPPKAGAIAHLQRGFPVIASTRREAHCQRGSALLHFVPCERVGASSRDARFPPKA
jgi:hypothetical protein